MLIQKELAKYKKCPSPRASGYDDDIPCIAEECMAWRWAPPLECQKGCKVDCDGQSTTCPDRLGYCGMAGKASVETVGR